MLNVINNSLFINYIVYTHKNGLVTVSNKFTWQTRYGKLWLAHCRIVELSQAQLKKNQNKTTDRLKLPNVLCIPIKFIV